MITRRRFVDGAVASIAGASVASTTRNYVQLFGAGERADSIRKRLNEGGAAPRAASKTVGLVVPDPFQRFFAEVAASLLNTLTSHEYGLIISSSRGDADLEDQVIRQMLGRNVDALVVASCKSQTEALEPAAHAGASRIFRSADKRTRLFRFVGNDDALAGELATRHLIDMGCRRIAYIGAAVSSSSDRERACRAVLSAITSMYLCEHAGENCRETEGRCLYAGFESIC